MCDAVVVVVAVVGGCVFWKIAARRSLRPSLLACRGYLA